MERVAVRQQKVEIEPLKPLKIMEGQEAVAEKLAAIEVRISAEHANQKVCMLCCLFITRSSSPGSYNI